MPKFGEDILILHLSIQPHLEQSAAIMGVFDKFSREKDVDVEVNSDNAVDISHGIISENKDDLQRRLGNRQIQLLAIGGSIGTALFVSIGGGLYRGGPGSLFIAYTLYSCMLG